MPEMHNQRKTPTPRAPNGFPMRIGAEVVEMAAQPGDGANHARIDAPYEPSMSQRPARDELWLRQVALSEREVETLTWAARGKTSAEIALIVGLSKRTVDFHIDNARAKLGVATRIEAAVKAAAGRLIEV